MNTWLKRIQIMSSTSQMINNAAYKAFINSDVPYKLIDELIEKLKEEPLESVGIMAALDDICGDNPVQEENQGYVEKMAEDWLDWYELFKAELGKEEEPKEKNEIRQE